MISRKDRIKVNGLEGLFAVGLPKLWRIMQCLFLGARGVPPALSFIDAGETPAVPGELATDIGRARWVRRAHMDAAEGEPSPLCLL